MDIDKSSEVPAQDQFVCHHCAKCKDNGQGHTDEKGQQFCCEDCSKRPAAIHPNTCEFC